MTLPNFVRMAKSLLSFTILCWSCLASSLTVTPNLTSVVVGASQLVNVSSINGSVLIENSKPFVVTVTKIDTNTYRIYGASPGTSAVKFKDRSSEVYVYATVAAKSLTTVTPLNGRLLASNCFQCHGTNGSGGFERLTGAPAAEIYGELKSFANGSEDATGIMAAHAMGFTDAQLRAIANYFASLR